MCHDLKVVSLRIFVFFLLLKKYKLSIRQQKAYTRGFRANFAIMLIIYCRGIRNVHISYNTVVFIELTELNCRLLHTAE